MAKFKFIEQQGQACIRCKLVSSESLNNGEIAYFSNNPLRGFMRPTVEDNKRLLYVGAQGMPIGRFLKNAVTKDQFFMIIAQIVEVVKTASHFCLNISSILFDPEYVIINNRTGELFFVYQNINNAALPSGNFVAFINEVYSLCRFATPQDQNMAANFMNYMHGMQSIEMTDLENFIAGASPLTYTIVPRMTYPPQPEPIFAPQPAPQPVQQPAPQPVQQGGYVQVPVNQPVPQPVQPDIPVQMPAQQQIPGNDLHERFAPPNRKENSINIDPVPEPEQVKIFKPEAEAVQTVYGPPEAFGIDDAPTNVIGKTEKKFRFTRRSTNESFVVAADNFRIGKERAKVDFCVTNNNTVSRVHLIVSVRNGECFIKDNKSLNKTYINGSVIPELYECKVKAGDVVRLSNEDFDIAEV